VGHLTPAGEHSITGWRNDLSVEISRKDGETQSSQRIGSQALVEERLSDTQRSKAMNKQCTVGIRAITVLGLILLCVSTYWISATKNVIAQTNIAQKPPTQEEKPFDQQQKIAELMKQIVGKENQPAEQVFKNVQMFKGMPAGRLLRIMQIGYSRSLGVNCTHCHIVDQWEKDDKPTKQIARDMAKMVQVINSDLLKNIENLKGRNPVVNCTTCHRGQTKPALNLPEMPKQ
jgi:hypothetical protein